MVTEVGQEQDEVLEGQIVRTPIGTFAPGHSGNLAGRPRIRKILTEALVKKLVQEPHLADQLISRAIDFALSGDVQFFREIYNRIEGPMPQKQIHQGDEEGGPIKHVHFTIVGKE